MNVISQSSAAESPVEIVLPTYQNETAMALVKQAARCLAKPGAMVIWREAFRWKNDEGVLPNHYEMYSLDELAQIFNYRIVHDFCHVAVVQAK